ncbi:MAG: YqeG family HAD IIIA-type phosphatase [Lachnospiraceae bacterium]|nr:YqeG family HAD IIIA-type phosphatase [Lachnospiraceae bacterium]
MFQIFYPTQWLDSTYQIPFEEWYERGCRGVIFDIDNTLVPHDAPATEEAKQLFDNLRKMGFDTCLTSNNKEPRVAAFALAVNSKYIYKANKPSRSGYLRAMEMMGTDKDTTLFVGDQLFTDVFGANRTGIPTILVKPINPKEEIQIVLKRYLERIVLYFYKKKLQRDA